MVSLRERAKWLGGLGARMGVHAEVALWTLVMLLAAGPLGQQPGFVDVQPSPLWFVILWGGLRGGLLPALHAAVLAGVLHGIGVLVASGNTLQALLAPETTWTWFAFAAVAWFVGQVRDVLGDELRRLRSAREQLQRSLEEHRADEQILSSANRELKRRVFDRSLEFDSLVATVAASELDDDEQLFEAPLQMLVDYCGATRCSALLVLAEGALDLAAHRGWTMGEIRPRVQAAANSPRVRAAISRAKPIVDFADEEISELGPVWIAPIADASGVIKVLLCIDEILPSRCDAPTTQTFLAIASWFTANLRRVQLQGAARATVQELLKGLEKQKHLGSPADLAERIHLEDARRQRYSIESSLLAIHCRDARVVAPHAAPILEQQLVELLSLVVRATDDIFHFGFPGCYVLVLTGCKPGDIEQLTTRLRERFAATGDEVLAALDLQPFVPGLHAPKLAGLLPLMQEHFTAASVVPLDHRCPVPEPRPQRRGTAAEFARRLGLELELGRRFSAEVNLVEFAHPDSDLAIGPMIARHLWNSVGTMLRVTDGIFVLGPERCVVMLPFTTCLDASRIQERLRESLARTIPAAHFAGVEVRFLSLADSDARQAIEHLLPSASAVTVAVEPAEVVPQAPAVEPRRGPVVTESELQELTFSPSEFEGIHNSSSNLANEFQVLRASGVETALPSPDAIRQRWAEVFERGAKTTPLAGPAAVVATSDLSPPLASPQTATNAAAAPVASVLPPPPVPASPASPSSVSPASPSPANAATVDAGVAAAVELVVGSVVRAFLVAGRQAPPVAAAVVAPPPPPMPPPPPAPSSSPVAVANPQAPLLPTPEDDTLPKVVALVERLRRQCLLLHEQQSAGKES